MRTRTKALLGTVAVIAIAYPLGSGLNQQATGRDDVTWAGTDLSAKAITVPVYRPEPRFPKLTATRLGHLYLPTAKPTKAKDTADANFRYSDAKGDDWVAQVTDSTTASFLRFANKNCGQVSADPQTVDAAGKTAVRALGEDTDKYQWTTKKNASGDLMSVGQPRQDDMLVGDSVIYTTVGTKGTCQVTGIASAFVKTAGEVPLASPKDAFAAARHTLDGDGESIAGTYERVGLTLLPAPGTANTETAAAYPVWTFSTTDSSIITAQEADGGWSVFPDLLSRKGTADPTN